MSYKGLKRLSMSSSRSVGQSDGRSRGLSVCLMAGDRDEVVGSAGTQWNETKPGIGPIDETKRNEKEISKLYYARGTNDQYYIVFTSGRNW